MYYDIRFLAGIQTIVICGDLVDVGMRLVGLRMRRFQRNWQRACRLPGSQSPVRTFTDDTYLGGKVARHPARLGVFATALIGVGVGGWGSV